MSATTNNDNGAGTATASVAAGLERVRAQIDEAAARAGRDGGEITLVAVSKGHDVGAIEQVLERGHFDLGESRYQEWRDKAAALPRRVRWHFIGPLQSNKVRYLVDETTLIHSIDRAKLIREIDKRAEAPQEILIQVDVAGEEQKGGCAPDDAVGLVLRAAESELARPRGLMTIPPYAESPESSRPHFQALRGLFDDCRRALSEAESPALEGFTELSMGMSGDFEVAIEEGATLVRVGTAIFGERGDDEE